MARNQNLSPEYGRGVFSSAMISPGMLHKRIKRQETRKLALPSHDRFARPIAGGISIAH
jgi:hypothetical protein